MICRNIVKSDLEVIRELNEQQDFKLQGIDNCIVDKIVLSDAEEVIAYGIVKHMAEAIILVNPDAPKISRAKAMQKLMEYAIYGSAKVGINQLHCFVSDPKLVHLLKNKYKFEETKDFVLVRHI